MSFSDLACSAKSFSDRYRAMDMPSDLSRAAALLADESQERFRVITYDPNGSTMHEVETLTADTAEAAIKLGEVEALTHAIVIVLRQTEDGRGLKRSVILKTFERDR